MDHLDVAVVVAVINGMFTLAVVGLNRLLAWRDAKKIVSEVEKTAKEVHKVELATNSMKDQLVAASHASGKAEGIEEERSRPPRGA